MSGTIVVGVDSSDAAAEALRWAATEASLRGARVVALTAWTYVPQTPVGDPGLMAVPSGNLAEELDVETQAARRVLEAAVRDALGSSPDVQVDLELVEDDAGEALVTASENADLVVVGSHGKSGFRAALLGSVSRHVVDHAKCPVVVVKPRG